jgi:hypothetical protein
LSTQFERFIEEQGDEGMRGRAALAHLPNRQINDGRVLYLKMSGRRSMRGRANSAWQLLVSLELKTQTHLTQR